MVENQSLRGLLKNLSAFIGDGAGGLLPKLGWNMSDFNEFVNRSETDTAWEGYQRRKKDGPASGQKRLADDDPIPLRSKKARNDDTEPDRGQNGFSLLVPMGTSSHPSNGIYAGSSRAQDVVGGMFQHNNLLIHTE